MNIDYRQSKKLIKYTLIHSNKNINVEDDNLLFDYYESLIRCRHDVLHKCVLEALDLPWEEEQSVAKIMGLENYPDYMNKTPDIFLFRKNTYYIIDVSISADIYANEKRKYEKYQQIANYLSITTGKNSKFIHINVKQSLKNIEKEIHKIIEIMMNEFDFIFVNEVIDLIEVKLDWLNKFTNKTIFEQRKKEKYGNKEVLSDNIGLYQDLDVDSQAFVAFNKKFNHIDKIVNPIESFNEEEFLDNMKIVLDNIDDPLYVKYVDNHSDKKTI